MTKPQKAIHICVMPESFKGGKWIYKTEEREVRVMAIAEGYAMVRRKGCMPYVCNVKELKFQSDPSRSSSKQNNEKAKRSS